MKHSIFIRSYSKDMEWLKYCLRSIKKNWDMSDGEVVVCFPNSEYDRLKGEILLDFPWVRLTHWIEHHKDGYIDQQINKLNADIFCNGDYIVFCDSDCFLTRKSNFKSFFKGKKPYWLKTEYNKVGDAICWKECTEQITKRPIQFEYMRRVPLVVKREHLKFIRDYVGFAQGEFNSFMSTRTRLSEFNLMGAILSDMKPEDYTWIDTDIEIPETPWIQGWSWGGMTEEKKGFLEGMLK